MSYTNYFRHIPNTITTVRLFFIIPMIVSILTGNNINFTLWYIFMRALDGVDGFIARKFKWTSELGSKLDSYADIIGDVVGFSGFFIIKPNLFTDNILLWVIPFGLLFLSWGIGYIICRKLVIMHLFTNKAFGLFFTLYLVLASLNYEFKSLLVFSVVTGVIMFIEQIAIYMKTKGNFDIETTSVFKIKY